MVYNTIIANSKGAAKYNDVLHSAFAVCGYPKT